MKKLGKFPLGFQVVTLYATSGIGGSFWVDTECAISVGIEYEKWHEAYSAMLHEASELAMNLMGLRYNACYDIAKENGAYAFMMNHYQFSEATARTGEFMSHAAGALEQHWKKKHKR